jgi:hypothetical protein
VKSDPKIRKDGLCYVCRQPIVTQPRKGLPEWMYEDPFCSTVCAKSYWELSEPRSRHAGTVKSY